MDHAVHALRHSIGLGLAIALGSWLIVQGTISAGNFVSFITALLMLYTPLKNITNVAVSVQQSFLAIDRVFQILERPKALREKEHPVPLPAVKHGVTFEHVCFSYTKGVEVLHDINLDVRVGEMLALVGNSGGGKSTLVSLLPRFYDVTRGSIKIDGTDIRDFGLNDLRQHIAVVFQDNFLFDGTIKENILLGNPSATDEDVKRALHSACLSEFIDSLDKGVDTYIGERGILLPAVRSSAWPLPAPSSRMRPSSFSTKPPPPSTTSPRKSCSAPSTTSCATRPCSSSRTASPP